MPNSNQISAFLGLPAFFLYGILFLCLFSFIILFLFLTLLFGISALMSHEFLSITNAQNIYITLQDGAKKAESVLLIPEFSVNIGIRVFAVGVSLFSKSTTNLLPLSPLMDANFTVDPFLPVNIREAYVNVRNAALQFGYAAAETCGGKSATEIMYMNNFIFVAMIIGVLCEAVAIVVASFYFFFMRKHITVTGTDLCIQWKFKKMTFCGEKSKVMGFMEFAHMIKRRERVMSILLLVFTFLGAILFAGSKIMEIVLRVSVMKCGKSFCDEYFTSMRRLFLLLPPYEYIYSCGVGSSSTFLLVAIVFSGLACIPVLAIFVEHFLSSYPTVTIKDVASGTGRCFSRTSCGFLKTAGFEISRSIKFPTTNINTSSHELSESAGRKETVTERSLPEVAARDGNNDSFYSTEAGSNGDLQSTKNNIIQWRCFYCAENNARDAIEALQQFEFSANISLIKQKTWHCELLLTSHRLFLCGFLGPLLKLHLLETSSRQRLCLRRYEKMLNILDLFEEKAAEEKLVAEHLRKVRSDLISTQTALGCVPQLQKKE